MEENKEINETQEITATPTQVNKVGKADLVQIEKIAGTKRVTQTETRGRIDAKKARTQLFQDIHKGRSERMTLLRDIAQRATTSGPQSTEDPIDLFFKSLAATAKTLSPRYLAEAKRKIFLDMAEIEEKNIEEKYPPSNLSPLQTVYVSTPSPSPSLPSHSDDSSSACHLIRQREYNIVYGHPGGPSSTYNTDSNNQEQMMSPDGTVQSYLTDFTPL